MSSGSAPARNTARELNEELRYTLYAALAVDRRLQDDRASLGAELEAFLEAADGKGVRTRGIYDLAAFRPDAHLMLWWTCPDPELLQDTFSALLAQTRLGEHLRPAWTGVGLHRPAEFNRSHVPAYLKEEEPGRWVCVYPYNRSLDWYLLPDYERRGMLAEHGNMGREFPDVRTNTVAAFGLGDYEWLLAFEADDLHRILDCLRHLRSAQARRHTKLETPFFTGRRRPAADVVAVLP